MGAKPPDHAVRFGDVEIHRVVEWAGPLKPVGEMFPDTPADLWTGELAPEHWVPETRAYRGAIQTWVLRSSGRTILVDTGVGNDRDRPQVPTLAHLRTDFLARLARAGVRPEDVDVVVNTHIHYNHVGWNTRLEGDRWVPTFPNATYLLPQADYDYYRPENAARMRPATTEDERARFEGIRLVFADSIAPIAATGRLQTYDAGHDIDSRLRLRAAPGHTPGSSVVWLDDVAVFVGDLVHTPVQLARPGDRCAFDLDADQARRSRRAVLQQAAEHNAAVFPAHFAGRGAVHLRTDADGAPAIDRWVDLPVL